MDTTTLQEYRRRLYEEVFVRRPDALFELADALLTYPQARSLVELSEAPLLPIAGPASTRRSRMERWTRWRCACHYPRWAGCCSA